MHLVCGYQALRRKRAAAARRGENPDDACEDPDKVTPERYDQIVSVLVLWQNVQKDVIRSEGHSIGV